MNYLADDYASDDSVTEIIDCETFLDCGFADSPRSAFLMNHPQMQVLSIRYGGFTAPNGQRIHDRWQIRVFDFASHEYCIFPYAPNQFMTVYMAEIEDYS